MQILTRITIIAVAVAFVLGILLFPALIAVCRKRKLFDTPGERKVHQNNTPRLGGLVFLPSALVGVSVCLLATEAECSLSWSCYAFSLMGLWGLFVLGVLDDLFDISAKTKFLVQIFCAAFIPLAGFTFDIACLMDMSGIYALLFNSIATVFVIVFVTNGINLIDGIDGLATCLSALAFVWFVWLFDLDMVVLAFISGMIGVLIAFLRHNLFARSEKNRLFMGDSGSLTLGYSLAFLLICVLSKVGCNEVETIKNALLASSLIAVPVLDECRVILVRLWHRQPLFQADKRHIHHLLMSKGLNQHQVLLMIIALQLVIILIAYVIV